MKIGLISDTHGSSKTFRTVMEGVFKDVEMILHAGDVLYHGPKNPLTEGYNTAGLVDEINGLTIPIMIAKGNCDSDVDQLVLNTPIMSPYIFLQIDGKRLMVLHGENKREEDLDNLVSMYGLSMLIHGHSHIPRIRIVGNGLVVNPGTPTIPNLSSPFGKTAAILDTVEGRVAIKDIDTAKVVLEERLES